MTGLRKRNMDKKHKHKFQDKEVVVPVRKVITEEGKQIRHTISARDTLKQRVCKCGQTETYDLQRQEF